MFLFLRFIKEKHRRWTAYTNAAIALHNKGGKLNAGVPKSGATKSGDLLPVSTKSGGPKSGETKSGMGQNPV